MIEQWLAMSTSVHLLSAGLLGLLVGSFLNVVIVRLPPMLAHRWALAHSTDPSSQESATAPPDLIKPRSHCPQCKHPIAWYDNIPLVSWCLLKGRCRHCHAPIDRRYPIIEGLTALLSLIVIWQLGPTLEGAAALILTWILIAASAIDLEHHILPDGLTLSLLWLGLLINGTLALFTTPSESILGAALGYGFLWLMFHAFLHFTGKEGLGYGDFKLLAGLGAWIGWTGLPLVLFIASVAGTIIGVITIQLKGQSKDTPLAFGPYLALAGWVVLLWGDDLLAWLYPALF